jgi:hypothetical protein
LGQGKVSQGPSVRFRPEADVHEAIEVSSPELPLERVIQAKKLFHGSQFLKNRCNSLFHINLHLFKRFAFSRGLTGPGRE